MDTLLTNLLKINKKAIVDDHDRLFIYIHTFIIDHFPQENPIYNIIEYTKDENKNYSITYTLNNKEIFIKMSRKNDQLELIASSGFQPPQNIELDVKLYVVQSNGDYAYENRPTLDEHLMKFLELICYPMAQQSQMVQSTSQCHPPFVEPNHYQQTQKYVPPTDPQPWVPSPYHQPLVQSPYQQPLAPSPYHQPLVQSPYPEHHQPLVQSPYQQPLAPSPYHQPLVQSPYQQPLAPSPYHQPLVQSPYPEHHQPYPEHPQHSIQ